MPTKQKATVDELGLRTHCPDGHRIYWSEGSRKGRTGDWYGKPRSLDYAHGGICSAGNVWDQQQTPTKQLRSWEMKGETKKYKVTGPPRLVRSDRRLGLSGDGSGGIARFTIKIGANPEQAGNRRVSCELRCARQWFTLDDREERADHLVINTDHVQTEENWLALVGQVKAQGWQLVGWVKCPTCLDELARFDAYMADMRARAKALEEQQP